MNDDDVAPLALAASPIVRGPIWTIEATEIFCQKLLQFGFGDAGTSFESLLNTFLKDSLNRRTLADCINRSEDRNFRNGLLFLAWHGCALNSPGKPSETADRLLAVIRLCDGVKILPEQSLGQLARLVGIPFYCTRIRSTVLHLVLPWDKKPLVDPPITGAAVRCLLGHRDQVPAAVTRRLPKVSFVGDADGG